MTSTLLEFRECLFAPSTDLRDSAVTLTFIVYGKGLLLSQVGILLLFFFTLVLNYSSSVTVKSVFSKGQLLHLHIWNCLSAQHTCALLCLGAKFDYVDQENLKAAASLLDVGVDETWSDKEWNVVG